MKRLRTILILSALVSAFAVISCEKPDPVIPDDTNTEIPDNGQEEKPDNGQGEGEGEQEEPAYPEAANENTYVINGIEYDFNSTAFTMVGENPAIAATASEGYDDLIKIMEEADEYFYAGLAPTIMGKEVDLMTESSLFTIISTLSEALILELYPDNRSEITRGRCKATFEDGTMTFKAGLELTDGTTLAVHITAEEEDTTIEINKNEIGRSYDNEVKPLRASFYLEEDGLTYLYFTPGAISYFEELEIAIWYMCLIVSDDLMTGEEFDINSVRSDQTFIFGTVDNLDGDKCHMVSNSDLGSSYGTFSIKKNNTGEYTARFNIVIEGDAYFAWFDGKCKSTEETAPVVEVESHFTAGSEKCEILSVDLEKGEAIWSLHINLDNSKTATLTMSPEFYQDGGIFGFSQDENMSFTYEGTTYSWANGNRGTITVYLDEETQSIEVEFTNYSGCEFYYKGPYNII